MTVTLEELRAQAHLPPSRLAKGAPGVLVLTGTPAGVGMARRRFLKAGDTVRLWIENVGELRHTVA